MIKKPFALIGLLLVLALFLGGCASGLTASAWPSITAGTDAAYISGGQYVYALNLQTGAQLWRFPEKASANPFYATPALTPDGKQLIVGGYDKKLYSLDPATGKTIWTFTSALDRWIGGALVTDSMIYAPNSDYKLYALNHSGTMQWSYTADQSIWGTPVTDGTNIYFGSLGRKVYAVNAQTGKLAWMSPVDGAVLGSPILGKGNSLYASTYNGSVYAFNVSNGDSHILQKASSWIWSAPTLDDSSLFVGDANGKLYAAPTSEAGQTWSQDLSGAIIGSPVIHGQDLIVGTEGGTVYFVGLDGKNVRPIAVAGKIYASPAVAGDLTLIAPTDGSATIVALDQTGATKWSFTATK